MTKTILTSTFVTLTFISQMLIAQSEFIERGLNAFGGGISLSTNKEASGFDVFTGYSYRGFLDGRLTYTKLNGGKIQGGFITPSVTFYPFKQEDAETVPTLGLSLGFSSYKYKETKTYVVPDTNIITWRSIQKVQESTINALIIGVTAQKRMGYWKEFFFQPVAGAVLSIKNSGWDFSLRGGISVGTRIINGPLLIATPIIGLQSSRTTYLLTICAVI